MNFDLTSNAGILVLQRAIRNAKEAVEKELGPLKFKDKNGEEKMDNFNYATYIELLRGIMNNLPKSLNVEGKGIE